MLFRQDINMLRAIAVIAVMLFHFQPNLVPGGFIGVDVFFVISGFLMTSIIIGRIKQNKFSIIEFYIKRAYRIVPALAVLCLVLLAFGWFWLTPVDYRMLGKHVASSLGFVSNFTYSFESGYFATSAQEKWLLHTWSLAVEMQFYFLYPIILVFLTKKFSFANVKRILLVFTLLSFILGIIATKFWPTYAYYLLPSRGWELLVGAIAYLYPWQVNKNNKILAWCGLLLIVSSCFIVSKTSLWPSHLASIPVFGTFLLIQAQYNNSLLATNFSLQKIGTWSYSIYLWHWPLVVIINLFSLNSYWAYVAMPLAVFLGFLSYNYVETIRFNYNTKAILNLFHSFPTYSIFCISLIATYIYLTNGKNANEFLMPCQQVLKYPKYCNNSKNIDCQIPYHLTKKPIGLLWGDSYAGHLVLFVKTLLNDDNVFISRSVARGFPSLTIDSMLECDPIKCREQRLSCIADINNNSYDIIFLAGDWGCIYNRNKEKGFNAIIDSINFCAEHAKLVYFFATPINYKTHVSNTFMRSQVSKLYPQKIIRDDKQAQLINEGFKQAIATKNYTNVFFVDRDTLYGTKNHQDLTANGLPYTFDSGHLTIVGSIEFAKNFMQSKLFLPLKKLLDSKL